MRKNVNYFKVNYLIWIVTVLLVCMLANPASLVVLSGALCGADLLLLCAFNCALNCLWQASAPLGCTCSLCAGMRRS